VANYVAVLFADLERHSDAWARVPRDKMVATIGEYRYLAESLAGQYGALYREWAGDGHMFLFESADAAVQFGLRLVERWQKRGDVERETMALRVGCHFGECTPMDKGAGWIGRANAIAKRAEGEASPNSLFVTESVLDLIDLPLYSFEESGTLVLKGDYLPKRTLYRVRDLDRRALEAKPKDELNAEEWFLRGVALVGTELENSDEEEQFYREALRLRPDYAEAHNNLAILLRSRGAPGDAANHYQEALRIRPQYPDAHANYAALLAARGSRAGAAQHFEEALRLRPDFVDAHHGYATLLTERGDVAEAAEHYREALRLRPESPEVHSNYAIVLEDLGSRAEAAEHYQEALRLRPDYPEAHYNYALLFESEGDTASAEAHYREALRLWPDYGEAHNNLAALLHVRAAFDEAEVHYREALRLRPQDPEVHYNYALLLRSRGDEDGADRHLRTARDLAPELPIFRSPLEPPL
jgi:tetratricopeptide (TPR) repeat protein